MHVAKGKNKFSVITVQINDEWYYFVPNKNYIMSHKFKIEQDKAITKNEEWDIVCQETPKQHIKTYERYLLQKNEGRE